MSPSFRPIRTFDAWISRVSAVPPIGWISIT
jgi:hypothetical protein